MIPRGKASADIQKPYIVDPETGRLVHAFGNKKYDANSHQLVELNGQPVHADKDGNIVDSSGGIKRTRAQMRRYTLSALRERRDFLNQMIEQHQRSLGKSWKPAPADLPGESNQVLGPIASQDPENPPEPFEA